MDGDDELREGIRVKRRGDRKLGRELGLGRESMLMSSVLRIGKGISECPRMIYRFRGREGRFSMKFLDEEVRKGCRNGEGRKVQKRGSMLQPYFHAHLKDPGGKTRLQSSSVESGEKDRSALSVTKPSITRCVDSLGIFELS